MVSVTYRGVTHSVPEGSTVLEILEKANVAIDASCRSGVCQTCVKKVIEGSVPSQAQARLNPAQREAGFFLPCVCYPTENIVMADTDQASRYEVTVLAVTFLNHNVAEIQLSHPEGFVYRAGQYIQVFKDARHIRTYSLASVPEQHEPLTLQVKGIPHGLMSLWLQKLSVGNKIFIAGPFGECFYTAHKKEQPIIMIGTGSGLSPLYGILQDALLKEHQGEIYLFHGVAKKQDLYKESNLRALSEKFSQFHYWPCLSEEGVESYEQGMVTDVALKKVETIKGSRVFLCGHPGMIKIATKKLFLAGVSMSDIHVDPFG